MEKFVLDWERYAAVARQAAAEGCVLLENRGNVLPIAEGSRIALFGRSQLNYYKSGTGSGGMVNTTYVHDLVWAFENERSVTLDEEVLKAYNEWVKEHPFDRGIGWAAEPWCQEEMPLSDEFVLAAHERCGIAVIVIGRSAGEDKDNAAAKGSYYLTDGEEKMLETVTRHFENTVVLLNVGNIIDMSWLDRYKPSAVMYIWQGGMEGGAGAVDVLTGRVPACGHLSDTIAYNLEDYPSVKNFGSPNKIYYKEDIYVGYRYFETFGRDLVRYPFGYGLSYTEFEYLAELDSQALDEGNISIAYSSKNIGVCAGKAVIQLYVECPQGKLGKPSRQLIGFSKSELLEAGESEAGLISIPLYTFASYDDDADSKNAFCYVLEAGTYTFYAGADVENAKAFGTFTLKADKIIEKLSQHMAPLESFERIRAIEEGGILCTKNEPVTKHKKKSVGVPFTTKFVSDKCPACDAFTGDKGYKLNDVRLGNVSMGEFLAQLSDDDLFAIVKGEGMCSTKVTPGTAAAFGGITPTLSDFGIPAGCCTDGPSGLRLDSGTNAFSLPGGTLLACTFNTALNADLFELEGLEMRNNHIESLLGPGMNIHRCPLNGRNFEYFSEDPYLTGVIAAAQLEGMARVGVTGTIKHFCANNQEFHRSKVDSILSERALREIYLKGFEIAVKSGYASSIMTTYGSVNGLWTAGNAELNTSILRDEWNYDGIVVTDWWADINNFEGDEASRSKIAAMVLAQNDIYMVTSDTVTNSDDIRDAFCDGRLERRHLIRCASNICSFLMKSPAMLRLIGNEPEIEMRNLPSGADVTAAFDMKYYDVKGRTEISLEGIPHDGGDSWMFGINTEGFGDFRISITASSLASKLAQIPISVIVNNNPFGVFSFNGTDGKDVTITREGKLFGFTHYVKLHFGLGGAEPKKLAIEPVNIVTSYNDK